MNSADRNGASELVAQWVEHEHDQVNHLHPLIDRIAIALSEVRRETWDAAIEIARAHFQHSGYTLHHKSEALGSELIDCRRAILFELESAALEFAREKDAEA